MENEVIRSHCAGRLGTPAALSGRSERRVLQVLSLSTRISKRGMVC
ncbi:unnamed protein product, partial [Gulo gulo]